MSTPIAWKVDAMWETDSRRLSNIPLADMRTFDLPEAHDRDGAIKNIRTFLNTLAERNAEAERALRDAEDKRATEELCKWMDDWEKRRAESEQKCKAEEEIRDAERRRKTTDFQKKEEAKMEELKNSQKILDAQREARAAEFKRSQEKMKAEREERDAEFERSQEKWKAEQEEREAEYKRGLAAAQKRQDERDKRHAEFMRELAEAESEMDAARKKRNEEWEIETKKKHAADERSFARTMEQLAIISSLIQESTRNSALYRQESETLATQENHECVPVSAAEDLNSGTPTPENPEAFVEIQAQA